MDFEAQMAGTVDRDVVSWRKERVEVMEEGTVVFYQAGVPGDKEYQDGFTDL